MRRFKDFYSGTFKFAFAILWIYVFAVFSLQTVSADLGYSVPLALFMCFVSFAFTYLVFYLGGVLSCRIITEYRKPNKKSVRVIFGIVFVLTLLVYVVHFICQYPGGSSPDVGDQYSQALSGSYNNWHPVLHTLLFYTLPLKLTNFGFPIIVILQILYFSIAFAYLISVMIKNGMRMPFAVLFCIFVWINPHLAAYLMYPWKDLAFMIFAIVLVAYYIQIVCSKGEWLKNKINLVLFSLISVLCMYMRHNALLFVVPLVVFSALYIRKNKKAVLGIVSIILVGILSVQGLYAVLKVEKPDSRVLETVGLPATVWCSVMQENPEALPEETREVMYQIATQEQYETIYRDGEFNSMKWGAANNEVIDNMSYAEVFKYTAQCFIYAPKASFEGLAKLTDMVWGFDENHAVIGASAREEHVGISSSPNEKLSEYYEQCRAFFTNSKLLRTLFGSYGVQILILLAVGLVLLAKKRMSIVHALPLLCYNFGTMLLLSGSDYRFFVFNIPIWLAVLFLMVNDKSEFAFKRKRKDKNLNIN